MTIKRLLIWFRNRGFLFFIGLNLFCLFASWFIGTFYSTSNSIIINAVIYAVVILFFIVCQMFRLTRFDFYCSIRPTFIIKCVFLGAGLYFFAIMSVLVVLRIVQIVFGNNLPAWFTAPNGGFTAFLDSPNILTKVMWIVFIVILGPFVEELLFRGYLQNVFACHFRKSSAVQICLTSLIFATFHYNSFANIIFAFFVGCWLSVAKVRSKNILVTTIIHGSVNAVSLLVAGLFSKVI